jgi:hypothetical protein
MISSSSVTTGVVTLEPAAFSAKYFSHFPQDGSGGSVYCSVRKERSPPISKDLHLILDDPVGGSTLQVNVLSSTADVKVEVVELFGERVHYFLLGR